MIYEGDCLEKMRGLDACSFDAVITDPPFGIGFKYDENKDVSNSVEAYYEWFHPIYEEMMRVLKPGGFFACWQAAKYFKHYWSFFGDDIHIYAGCKNFVQLRKTPINYGFDPIILKYKEGADPLCPFSVGKKPKRNLDFFVANNAAALGAKVKGPEKNHPCPRPLDQVMTLLENFVIPEGTVLDPFLGSGTLAVGCKRLGFKYIGIEKEKKYFDIATKRIELEQGCLL